MQYLRSDTKQVKEFTLVEVYVIVLYIKLMAQMVKMPAPGLCCASRYGVEILLSVPFTLSTLYEFVLLF